MPQADYALRNSQRLAERAAAVIPGASGTLSKSPSQWVQGVAPCFIDRGTDGWVTDSDGHHFLDLTGALGAVLLGYQYPAVDHAVIDQLHSGMVFGLPHRLELEVAERITEVVPGAERVRFVKNGSDATAAAVRLARIHTGRTDIISAGYHGQSDIFMAGSAYSEGIPHRVSNLIQQVPLDDLAAIKIAFGRRLGQIACLIIEPTNTFVPSSAYLQELIDLTHAHGALVIFDEVITGFRLALGGAQEHFDVRADLMCFGKSLANGMPLAAVAGPVDIMSNISFLSYTFAGEALSLAAARATISTLASESVHEHVWRLGGMLARGIEIAIERYGLGDWVKVEGLSPRTIVTVREPKLRDGLLPAKSLLQQELVRRGVLWNGNNFMMYAHTDADVEMAIGAYDEALGVLADALPDKVEKRLDGSSISQVFWQGMRGA